MSPKPPSSSKRSASAISIDLSPPSGSTNATYATWVCTTLAGYSTDLNFITAQARRTYYELPDCFWKSLSLTTNLQSLSLSGMIVRGNINGTSGQPGSESTDPLLRIPSTVTNLRFSSCQFIATNSTSVYAPNFQTVMDWFQSLTSIYFDQCYIPGTMFTTMPPSLLKFYATSLGLTGTISPSLFSGIGDNGVINGEIIFELGFNQLTGSIPSSLFSSVPSHFESQFSVVRFVLDGNQLTGTLPADLIPTWSSLGSFTFSIAGNGLTGSLPSQFLNPSSLIGSDRIAIDLSSNQFSGSVPSDFAAVFRDAQSLTLSVSNNSLTGPLPALFSNMPNSVSLSSILLTFSYNGFTSFGPGVMPNSSIQTNMINLDLSHNAIANDLSADAFDFAGANFNVNLEDNLIAGSVPSGLLDRINTFVAYFQLSLANNKLTGTIPDSLFDTNHFQAIQFSIASNPSLQGSIPSSLTKAVAGVNSGEFKLNFSSCAFSGAVPTLAINGSNMGTVVIDLSDNQLNNGSSGFSLSSFFSPSLNTDHGSFYAVRLDISNNKFEGALNFVNLPSGTRMLMHDILQTGIFFNGSGNAFSQLAIDDSWTTTIKSLDVSNNLKMTSGALPHALFNSTTMLSRIYASNTGLNGTLPNIESEYISEFDFRNNSGIDFCGSSRTKWASSDSLNTCLLQQTNASYCPRSYPSNCEFTALPPSPIAPAVVPAAVPSVRTPTGAANAVAGLSVAITIVIAVVLAMVM